MYLGNLDDVVNKFNNKSQNQTYWLVNQVGAENNNKDPKFNVGDLVRKSYQNVRKSLQKTALLIGQ